VVIDQAVLINDLRAAILKRRLIAFACGAMQREFSPHALGTRQGIWHVYGWDNAASPPDWKCIELRTITSAISICDGPWQRGVRAPHAKSKYLDFIYTEVDPAYGPVIAPAKLDRIEDKTSEARGRGFGIVGSAKAKKMEE
jgi:hypothetical protein